MRYTIKNSAEPWKCYGCQHWYGEDDPHVEAATGSHHRCYCPECAIVAIDCEQTRLARSRARILHYHATGQVVPDICRDELGEDAVEEARRHVG